MRRMNSSVGIYRFMPLKFNDVAHRRNNGKESRLYQFVFKFSFICIWIIMGDGFRYIRIERIQLAICIENADIPSTQMSSLRLFVEVYSQVQPVIIAISEIVARFYIGMFAWVIIITHVTRRTRCGIFMKGKSGSISCAKYP